MSDTTSLIFACAAVLALTTTAWAGGRGEPASRLDPNKMLSTLQQEHPRLILTEERLAELRKIARTDRLLADLVEYTIARADKLMKKPMLKRELKGPRLLGVSREMVDRAYTLGLAYRWTGEKKYADRLARNLLAVCAFPDWNPSHFLDVAEMSHAVGVGYDWIFDTLDDTTRKTIRQGLIENGLKPGRQAYQIKRGPLRGWWAKVEHNWNQVCNGGLAIGALAIAGTDPAHAKAILPKAVRYLPLAIHSYAPDGAWGEGPGYWYYATRYTVYALAAMQTALGKDFGLSEIDGLDKAGEFPIYMTSPTGGYLNFADVGERSVRGDMPCLLWLGQRYRRPLFINAQREQIVNGKGKPLNVVWYRPATETVSRRLNRLFRGDVSAAVFRSAWDDPNALWLGVKAGYNQVNHGHLDLGNFEIEASGVRWARDLGKDNYNLPGYWSGGRGGTRWGYYRLNSLSHNVLLLNGKSQDAHATSEIVRYASGKDHGLAVVGTRGLFPGIAEEVVRGVRLDRRQRLFRIQDELILKKVTDITWGMTTDAKIELDGKTATLTQDGRKLIARLVEAPEGARFARESARQESPQKTNRGVRRLLVKFRGKKGPQRLVVELVPLTEGRELPEPAKVVDLDKWGKATDR
ncbi:MAG: heparinase II/III family protein [Phycisphaerae bacterium]